MTSKAGTKKPKGAELRDTPTEQLKHKALDSYYVDAYLENPKLAQVDVLRIAMKDAEIEGNATRQFAYLIHDRNRDKINTEMVKLASDLKNLSISVIKDLMINSDSDSVKLSAAQTGTKDIFPNVSIKKEELTPEERRDKITKLQQDLQAEQLH